MEREQCCVVGLADATWMEAARYSRKIHATLYYLEVLKAYMGFMFGYLENFLDCPLVVGTEGAVKGFIICNRRG